MPAPLVAAAAPIAKKIAYDKGKKIAKKAAPFLLILTIMVGFGFGALATAIFSDDEASAQALTCGLGNTTPVDATTQMGIVLQSIRTVETGSGAGDYTGKSKSSTASGAYQFTDGTWNHYQGYAHAYLAPPTVQDAKAVTHIGNMLITPGVEFVGPVWYLGHVPKNDSEWNTAPKGNTLTPRQYQAKWMGIYNDLIAKVGAVTPVAPPNASPVASGVATQPTLSGPTIVQADAGDASSCTPGVVGGGDPSMCPHSSEVPANTLRSMPAGEDLFDLCTKSVTTARSPAAGKAIIWALHHLNIPYGGNGCPGTREGPSGYDCSGFVSHAYSDTGTNLLEGTHSPTTSTMVGNWSKAYVVSQAQALPGDLFVYNSGSHGHVVMLLADGMKVHTNHCTDVSHVTKFSTAGSSGTVKFLAIKA